MTVADALAVDVPRVNGSADRDLKLNGVPTPIDTDNGALSSGPDSPAISSPPTNADSPAVKIDLDYAQRESDVRHDPIPLSIEKHDDVSTHPQLGSPQDPASIPIAPPKGSPPPPTGLLMDDVMIAERPALTSVNPPLETPSDGAKVNGFHASGVVNGANGFDGDPYRSGDEGMSVDTPIASTSRPLDGAATEEPPTKRARKLSDAELASLANSPAPVPPLTPPTTASTQERSATPSPPKERKATLSQQQYRFCISTIRQLRKLKDAAPFLQPVDPVALNIPHYPSIVKRPMDFSTIDRKLASSNPAKPDPNLHNPRYLNSDEFVSDVHLIFSNAALFNGIEHPVTLMGRRVEAIFDKQIKQLPSPAEEPKPPVPKKVASPTPPPPTPAVPQKKSAPPRRPSTSVPTIRRSETTETARPKREIHPPPPKDLPYAEAPKKMRSVRKAKVDDGTEEQLKFCSKLLNEFHKKSIANIASHFYFPVDPIAMNIPQYAKIIKKPMDLSTMRKKLDNREYPNAEKFYEDFTLMIRNCMTFNPIGNPVHQAGVELQRLFEEKWASLPPLKTAMSEDEDEEEEEDSDEERARTIALMESQIETMKGNLAALKNQNKKQRKEKKEKKREKRISPPVASSSKANGKSSKPSQKKKGSNKEKVADDDVLSFDQKKELSEAMENLEEEKMEKAIAIIHEGLPHIRDSTEQIDLDIDELPARVLMKLYNFVLRPLRQKPSKRARTGTGTGTGGLKRKSMDEDVEAEKIRMLEERMKEFDANIGERPISSKTIGQRHDDSGRSSDESSSDDSDSDSD